MSTRLLLAGARLEQLLHPECAHRPALEKGTIIGCRLRGLSGQVYYLYIPKSAGKRPPLLVSVHGISRNAIQHAQLLAPMAERYGVVLVAPLFSRDQFPDYQRLSRFGRGPRSDLALGRIIDEVSSLSGADSSRLYLFGYSRGAQFVHRYSMAHAERVAGAVIGAAGCFSLPQQDSSSPHGAGMCRDLPGLRFDAGKFLRIPMTVVIGNDDAGRDQQSNQAARVGLRPGRDRLQRAMSWAKTMNLLARCQGLPGHFRVETIVGLDHSLERGISEGAMDEKIFAHLFDKQYLGGGRLLARA